MFTFFNPETDVRNFSFTIFIIKIRTYWFLFLRKLNRGQLHLVLLLPLNLFRSKTPKISGFGLKLNKRSSSYKRTKKREENEFLLIQELEKGNYKIRKENAPPQVALLHISGINREGKWEKRNSFSLFYYKDKTGEGRENPFFGFQEKELPNLVLNFRFYRNLKLREVKFCS